MCHLYATLLGDTILIELVIPLLFQMKDYRVETLTSYKYFSGIRLKMLHIFFVVFLQEFILRTGRIKFRTPIMSPTSFQFQTVTYKNGIF